MKRPGGLSDAEWERIRMMDTDPRVTVIEELMKQRGVVVPDVSQRIGNVAARRTFAAEIVATLDK